MIDIRTHEQRFQLKQYWRYMATFLKFDFVFEFVLG